MRVLPAIDQVGAGEPLVLIHGLATSRQIWNAVLPALSHTRRVTTLDVPGFGESEPVGAGFELEAVAVRIGQGLDAAGVKQPFDLVGHSLGAGIALTLACRMPDRVRRLVLVAPAGLAAVPRTASALLSGSADLLLATRRRLAPLTDLRWGRRLLLGFSAADAAALSPTQARMLVAASASAQRTASALATITRSDLRPLLARCPAPLAAIWGAGDRTVPLRVADVIRDARPEAEVVTIDDAGHVVMVERPAAFAAALEGLLTRLPKQQQLRPRCARPRSTGRGDSSAPGTRNRLCRLHRQMSEQADKAARFLELHRPGEPLVMPNAWDAGSAKVLASLGFQAIATTSSGFAATLGRIDYQVSREEALEHSTTLAAATGAPVSADLENAYADDPRGVAETIKLAIDTGLAGCSVEDFTGNKEDPIHDLAFAAERVQAAAEAAHSGPVHFVLTARAENYLHGRRDLGDTIARLQAYQEAGADVLYAPGLRSADEIRQLISSVDRPVNVILLPGGPTVAELAQLGAARISVGGALAFNALGALVEAATELRDHGTYGFAEQVKLGAGAAREAFS